jgi:hypothetical protein
MTQQITSLSPPPPEPLLLPDGRAAETVPHGELYGELDRIKVPGFSHRAGRTDNERAYAEHLRGIHDEAGRAAVAAWLAANK